MRYLALSLLVISAFTTVALAAGPALTLYVAPGGSDAFTGRLAETNAAGTDGPFATLPRARDAIRELKKAGPLPAGGVCVQVRAGAYELPATLKLDGQDAGTEQAPVVYRAYPGEKVILTGARTISGFTPYQGAILKADVTTQGFKGVAFRQLFLDGRRQTLARYPNYDAGNPHGGGFAYVDGTPLSMYQDLPEENLRTIQCKPRDVRRWSHPETAELIIFPRYNWINMSLPIAATDPEKGTITLGRDVAWGNFKGLRPLDRYYVRNVFEELDAPGEWYLDKESGTLYFWPPAPLGNSVVRAPVIETVFDLVKADWVTLQGFTIESCDGTAVNLRDCSNCLVAGNTVHDTGSRLGGSSGVAVQGGRNCGVVGNDLFEVCNNGIRIDGPSPVPDALSSSGHSAENNYVHHIGVLNGHGVGIYLSGVGVRVSHNLIHDITRCGVFGGGTDCVVEYNHIRHVNLETEDTGGFYTGASWHVRGLVVRYNWIHDVLGYGRTGDRWSSPHFAWGIYLDDDLSGAHVYGNIVARTTLGGSHIHAGRDNVLENNIFIEGARQQMQYSGHDPESWVVKMHLEQFEKAMARPAYQQRYPELAAADRSKLWLMSGNKFLRNIVYYRNPEAKLYAYSRNDAPETNETDYNLIWHFGLPLNVGLPGVPVEKQWEEFRKRGFEQHSLVADPLFADPEHDNYELRPDSPALALGFKPIPVKEIGLYASELRASWPVVEAPGVRETPLVETRVELPAAPVRVRPQAVVPKVTVAPTVDGVVGRGEWPGTALPVQQSPDGATVKSAPCQLRLAHDGTTLYVAVTVPVADLGKLTRGATWERDDAAEVCFREASGTTPGPTFVSHGFAGGRQESVGEAGAPAAAVAKLGAATRFAAAAADGQWTAEWAMPLAAAGLQARPGLKLDFNVGVRRLQPAEWLQWCGSGSTWTLDKAGTVVLQ